MSSLTLPGYDKLGGQRVGKIGLSLLNYIDDFVGAASTESEAVQHFSVLQVMFERLELNGAKHKACPPPLK